MVILAHLQPDLKAFNTTLCQGCEKENEATKGEISGEAWNIGCAYAASATTNRPSQ